MRSMEVLRVLDGLDRAGVRAALTGGWGIDALLGRETRPHGDADLGVPVGSIDDAVAALGSLGYSVVTDELPARLVMRSSTGQVDLHPIEFETTGHGIQHGLEGERFEYPPGSLDAPGTIDGRPVRCGTPELQMTFHAHYDPRPHDIVDIRALASAFGLELPPAYRVIDDRGAP